jgi:zinc transporter, ZIP family
VLGGAIGAWRSPTRRVTAVLLGFAAGALISAVAFDLFADAFEHGGALHAGAALLAGATVFVLVDSWLDRKTERRQASGLAVGFALLAGVTLDGVPENLAMGVSLLESASLTLLVAIFASNLPESIVGAEKMREAGLSRGRIMMIWTVTAVLLAAAVVGGVRGPRGRPEAGAGLAARLRGRRRAGVARGHVDARGLPRGRPDSGLRHRARVPALVHGLGGLTPLGRAGGPSAGRGRTGPRRPRNGGRPADPPSGCARLDGRGRALAAVAKAHEPPPLLVPELEPHGAHAVPQ